MGFKPVRCWVSSFIIRKVLGIKTRLIPVCYSMFQTSSPSKPGASNTPKEPKNISESGTQSINNLQEKLPGLGCIYTKKSTTFRVWAPNAKSVSIKGEFLKEGDSMPMQPEENGYWAAVAQGVKPGQAYKFLIESQDGDILEKNDPCARQIDASRWTSIVYDDTAFDWGDAEFQMPAWNELVLYELHIGTFHAKDGKPGTFYTAAEKLDYLAGLGVNAIKVMPPAEFPGELSWGYNPSFPYAAESAYGGPDGLKHLIKEAHGKGIAVIIDVVYNHFGPMDMDLWRFDGWFEGEGGGIYFYNDERAKTPWGHTRPDYGRGEVRNYILNNALMWLGDFRADGIRVDSVSHIRSINGSADPEMELPDGWLLLQELNKVVKEKYPWKITIAEDLMCNDWVTRHREEGGAGFDSQWDCQFVHPIRRVLTESHDEHRSMEEVARAVSFYYGGDAFNRIIYTESHDDVAEGSQRVPEEITPGDPDSWFAIKRSLLGVLLAAVSPGIPMIFQGQEFCFDREFQDTHPLDWSRAERYQGLVRMVGDAFRLRRNFDNKSRGLSGQNVEVLHMDDERNVLAFHRSDGDGGPGNSVVVIVNLGIDPLHGYTIPFPHAGHWDTLLNSASQEYHESFSNIGIPGLETTQSEEEDARPTALVDVGAYSVLVMGFLGTDRG